jgi:hypothetical protein
VFNEIGAATISGQILRDTPSRFGPFVSPQGNIGFRPYRPSPASTLNFIGALAHRSCADDLLAINGRFCPSKLATGLSASKWNGDRASEDDEEMKRLKTIT